MKGKLSLEEMMGELRPEVAMAVFAHSSDFYRNIESLMCQAERRFGPFTKSRKRAIGKRLVEALVSEAEITINGELDEYLGEEVIR